MAKQFDKCRLCRREGRKLFLKGARCFTAKCPVEKKGAQPPGVHGPKRPRRPSSYGLQLREIQKTKRLYAVLEHQFRRFLSMAEKQKGAIGENLLILLERRLDNVVYTSTLAPSKSLARQLVSHGHVAVNGQKVNTASFLVKKGDKIALSTKGQALCQKINQEHSVDQEVPPWLKKSQKTVEVIRFPVREEINPDIDENVIIEYYSR